MNQIVLRLVLLTLMVGALSSQDVAGQGLPASSARFFFSGESTRGRGLWVYDPADPDGRRAEIATESAVEPREITAVGGTVFFRADYGGSHVWLAWRNGTLTQLAPVALNAFDTHLPPDERNLGVRAGSRFWAATGDSLVAWDENGNQVADVLLRWTAPTRLIDAGGTPAFAATLQVPGFPDSEQVLVVQNVPGWGWIAAGRYSNSVLDPRNDIREIAGFRTVHDTATGYDVKAVFFAGDYANHWTQGTFDADALWRYDMRFAERRYGASDPWRVDLNETGGTVPVAPRALTVVPVADGWGGRRETLFLFGTGASGEGRIFAYRYEPVLNVEPADNPGTWTSADLAGGPLRGLAMAPWTDGVVFSALGEDGMGGLEAVVGTWTDADGDGNFEMTILFTESAATIEHMVADPLAGHIAFVVDAGDTDTLRVFNGSTIYPVVTRFGDIDELRLAAGTLVYRQQSFLGPYPTLFSHDIATQSGIEVPTDENTGGNINAFEGSYNNVAIPEALVFEAFVADQGGRRLFVTDGQTVAAPGFEASSAGDVLNGAWVGNGRHVATNEDGLFRIDSEGQVTALHLAAGFSAVGSEAEVLGDQVLFSVTGSPGFRIMLYDAALGSASVLLDDHILGAAEKVGSRLVFSAFDRTRTENTDSNPNNDVWDLWTYSPNEGARLRGPLPPHDTGLQPVTEWFRDTDFLGDDRRIYWKQRSNAFGIEVFMIDLAAANPVPVAIDINPGTGWGANWVDGAFANGRLYWAGSVDNSSDRLRLWTTDGTSAIPVTGPDLFGGSTTSETGFQLPYEVVTIGDAVFFLARIAGTDRWGVFQVNDDGITASLITPRGFPTIYGLSAIGPDLYFFAPDFVTTTGQMWRITPAATPAVATPLQLTNLPPINGAGDMRDIFLGGDANVYFGRLEPDTGRQLWVLDVTAPAGARRVTSFNIGAGNRGYAPRHVVAVIDPAPANTPPVANADTFSGPEDTVITGNVLLNDTDADGDPLTARLAIAPQYGTVTLNPDGSFTYIPNPDFFGTDSFAYVASDGLAESAPAIVTIVVTPVNDPPVGVDDSATTAADTPVVIDVLANDIDVDGDVLAAGAFASLSGGTLSLPGDGTVAFTPNPGFEGTGGFTYRPFDGQAQGNVTTVRVIVTPPNRPPVANDVAFAIDEDMPFIANMFGFTSDPDLNQASIQILSTTNLTVTRFNAGTGEIEVVPVQDFNGIAIITYQVTDAGGLSDTGVVTLTVVPVDDPPVGVPDTATTVAGTMVVIDVLANDYDVDGDALYAFYTVSGHPANGFTVFFPGLPGGPVHYTPNPGFVGTDTFTYMPFTIRPEGSVVGGNETTVTVTVVANTAPVGNADAFTVQAGQTLTVPAPGVLANDTDADGDSLVVSEADTLTSEGGSVTVGADGRFTYTPPANFTGTDSFTYRPFDRQAQGNLTTVTVRVTPPVNTPPVGINDEATTTVGTPVIIDVLANDTDAEDDTLVVGSLANMVGGTASVLGDGTVLFTPAPGFVGIGGFSYRPSDGQAQGNVTAVSVEVTAAAVGPRIGVRVVSTTPGAGTVTLEISNIGGRTASNVVIDRVGLRRLEGRGRIQLQTPLPVTVGTLAAGERRQVTLSLSVDPRVRRFALTARGSFVNPAGRTRRFAGTQTIVP